MRAQTYTYEEGCIERYAKNNRVMSNCIQTIKNILKQEHYKARKSPFDSQTALNLDEYERKNSCGNTQHTVDFVVGLKGCWLLPVEAKLDVKNVDNIPRDIDAKRTHSLDLLHSVDGFVHSTPFVVILLDKNNFYEKANKLKRLLGNSPSYVLCTVDSFYKSYFL